MFYNSIRRFGRQKAALAKVQNLKYFFRISLKNFKKKYSSGKNVLYQEQFVENF